MRKSNIRQPWRAIFGPQIEWVDDLGIPKLQPRDSSDWSSQVGNAGSSVPDNPPVSETIRRKVQVLQPSIQREIFIEENLIEHLCTYEQVTAIPLFAVAILILSNVGRYRRSCRLSVYTGIASHPVHDDKAGRNNDIFRLIQKIFHALDEIGANLHVIIQEEGVRRSNHSNRRISLCAQGLRTAHHDTNS